MRTTLTTAAIVTTAIAILVLPRNGRRPQAPVVPEDVGARAKAVARLQAPVSILRERSSPPFADLLVAARAGERPGPPTRRSGSCATSSWRNRSCTRRPSWRAGT